MARFVSRFTAVAAMILAIVAGAPCATASTGTELFLPAAGTGPGVPPSVWYTTIWIFNPNDVPAQVDLSFLRRNQANDPSALMDSDNFRLRVTGGPGDGRVLVFGSRVANGSQDATTFSMVYPPAP